MLRKAFLTVLFTLLFSGSAPAHIFVVDNFRFADGQGTIEQWHQTLQDNNIRFTSQSVDRLAEKRLTPGETGLSYQMMVGRADLTFSDDPEDAPNVDNAVTALRAVNGMIVQPGGEFSFNQAVGPRTEDRGYVVGYSYSGGEKVPDIGGGVCRASTLLYSSVVDAGLTVLERHPHSVPVEYVPEDMDAAVWWGALDFRFRNDRPNPMVLEASLEGRTLGLRIWEQHSSP